VIQCAWGAEARGVNVRSRTSRTLPAASWALDDRSVLTVRSRTPPDTWDHLASLVETDNGSGGCVLVHGLFHPAGVGRDSTAADNREAKHRLERTDIQAVGRRLRAGLS